MPIAFTPVIMKCIERMILFHIKHTIPAGLDSHQFAYQGNSSTEDAICLDTESCRTQLRYINVYLKDSKQIQISRLEDSNQDLQTGW